VRHLILSQHHTGHLYSREAIVEYLLTKTVEVRQARENYETFLEIRIGQGASRSRSTEREALEDFEDSQRFRPKRDHEDPRIATPARAQVFG
jgi:hypothetical protein